MPMNPSKTASARQWSIWLKAGALGGCAPRLLRPENIQRVYQAEAYRYDSLGSFGNASYMLIRQHQFPNVYDADRDKFTAWDDDRVFQNDYEHARRCYTEHTGTGEMGLESWLRKTTPQQAIDFIVDMLKAERKVKWTGFRVMGTVNRATGYVVWTLEIFAKHPQSTTAVYDTESAPNLIRGSRYEPRSREKGKPNWTFDEFGVSH
jgi:hypothetical protein